MKRRDGKKERTAAFLLCSAQLKASLLDSLNICYQTAPSSEGCLNWSNNSCCILPVLRLCLLHISHQAQGVLKLFNVQKTVQNTHD